MAARDDGEEPVAYVISRGRLADFLLSLSLPVFAWPGRQLFRVVLHGSGFVLPVDGRPSSVGFYITYFVAGRDVRSAERKAAERLNERWANVYDEAAGELIVETEEVERLDDRFMWRSRSGFVFYSSDE